MSDRLNHAATAQNPVKIRNTRANCRLRAPGAWHRKLQPRLSSFLRELRVLRGAHCDWIAALLNAAGAIQHESFDGQVSQRYSRLIVQNFPFRLDKPTGAASCSFSPSNYKSSAHARRTGTGREHKSPKVGQSPSHQAGSSVEHVTRRAFVLSTVSLGITGAIKVELVSSYNGKPKASVSSKFADADGSPLNELCSATCAWVLKSSESEYQQPAAGRQRVLQFSNIPSKIDGERES